MFRRIRNKKGNTLAELCVVMAIIGIVSTMVISFCTLVSAQTITISKTNEIQDDNTLVKRLFYSFVEQYDDAGYVFAVGEREETEGEPTKELEVFDARIISGDKDLFTLEDVFFVDRNEDAPEDNKTVKSWLYPSEPGSDDTGIPLNYIKSADFRIDVNDEGRCLITCTLTYRDLKGNDQTVTLMKATRVAKAYQQAPEVGS